MAFSPSPRFTAAGSALGYLFQIEYALLETLRRLRREPDLRVRLEVLDDVVFEADGQPLDIVQTKHRQRATGSLSDRSADLWKTLRVWAESLPDFLAWGATGTLGLVTTARAPDGSAAALLRADAQRDVERARSILDAVAADGGAEANRPGYEAWRALDDHERRNLLERMVVFDGAPDLSDLPAEFDAELAHLGRRQQRHALLDRLRGLWLELAVQHLTGARPVIQGAEVQDAVYDLVDQLREDNLPIDPAPGESDDELAALYAREPFVAQLELIAAGAHRFANALRDYHRAYAQRSRWEREELLNLGELDRYEDELITEWRQLWGPALDDLPANASEAHKQLHGRQLLDAISRHIRVSLRPRCDAGFLMRGSLHMLAGDLRVGWHPEFRERLEQLLLGRVGRSP